MVRLNIAKLHMKYPYLFLKSHDTEAFAFDQFILN